MLQSCQREITFQTGNPSPDPPGADSNYLWKMYELSISAASSDTVGIITYNYDNLKRVTSIVDSSKDLSVNIQQSYYYFYHNSDTLPYKSVLYEVDFEVQLHFDTTITWHFYDNSGRNLEDSSIYTTSDGDYSFYKVQKFSYGANKIYGYTHWVPIGTAGVYSDKKDTASLDANGNIVDNKARLYNSFTDTWDLYSTSIFSYDNKPSPFSLLSNFKTFGVFPSGETFYNVLPEKNNRLVQNEQIFLPTGGTVVNNNFSFTNVYKSNGFLKEISIYDQPPIPTEYAKIFLKYKSL
jgi:hypothetical protein